MINTAESNHQKPKIWVMANSVKLKGNLFIPNQAQGVVVFAHDIDCSRFSPSNQYVAQTLQQSGIATLLIDLLTIEEAEFEQRTKQLRFDLGLLAKRLLSSIKCNTSCLRPKSSKVRMILMKIEIRCSSKNSH